MLCMVLRKNIAVNLRRPPAPHPVEELEMQRKSRPIVSLMMGSWGWSDPAVPPCDGVINPIAYTK